MKNKLVIKDNQIQLPCKVGDTYYKFQNIYGMPYVFGYDKVNGTPLTNEKQIGVELISNKWSSYWEIVKELEIGRVGKTVFLTLDKARERAKELRKTGISVSERV